jgi:poly(hydroxyalkanoate) depolymerase family esterase
MTPLTRRLPVVIAIVLVGALAHAAPAPRGTATRDGEFLRGEHEGRPYRLFVPSSTPATSTPLVLALHGCWQTPEDFAIGTRLNEAAGRRGRLVLYPAQLPRDNLMRCWNWFAPEGEVRELLALVRQVQSDHGLADATVLAVGISAGAFMALEVACAAPDVVVAVGLMAGGPYRCATDLTSSLRCMRAQGLDPGASAAACLAASGRASLPLRASAWQGAEDSVVAAGVFPALASMLARVTGSSPGPAERTDAAVRTVYRDARGRPRVETWLVTGMGHAWSGGDARGSHTYPAGPDATTRLLDFLLDS